MKLYKKTVSVVLVFALLLLSVTLFVNAVDVLDPGEEGGGQTVIATYSGYASVEGKSIRWAYYEKATADYAANALYFNYQGSKANGTCRIIKNSYSPDTASLDPPGWQFWVGDEDKTYKSVEFSGGITTIGNGTCYNAKDLETVTINWSSVSTAQKLKDIYSYAFEGCTKIKTINFYGTKSDWESINIAAHNGVLNYSFEEMAKAGITFNDVCDLKGHKTSSVWSSDENSHWQECTACGEKLNSAAHHFVDNICDVCNYSSAILGDFDNDKLLTKNDADMLASHLIGKVPLSDDQLKIADVNGDKSIDVSDCVAIMIAANAVQ